MRLVDRELLPHCDGRFYSLCTVPCALTNPLVEADSPDATNLSGTYTPIVSLTIRILVCSPLKHVVILALRGRGCCSGLDSAQSWRDGKESSLVGNVRKGRLKTSRQRGVDMQPNVGFGENCSFVARSTGSPGL